jgi:hypothetical protein
LLKNGIPVSLSSFMSDQTKLLTFSANAPIQMGWTSTVSTAKSVEVGYYDSKDTSASLGLPQSSLKVSLGELMGQAHGSERTVQITLDDHDAGDYFAVRVTEDAVYGTPVFTTMGGDSKCPGETGTSRRESKVRIVQIQPRCGATQNGVCTGLTVGSSAEFSVVIQNLSPTRDDVYYTLRLAAPFDDFNTVGGSNTYSCGSAGQMGGLTVEFSATDLRRIPYNRLVEVPFTVTNHVDLCASYASIAVKLVATCEAVSGPQVVYQYGVAVNATTGEPAVVYDPSSRYFPSNSTATFDVTWVSKRRLSAEEVIFHSAEAPFADRLKSIEDMLGVVAAQKYSQNDQTALYLLAAVCALLGGVAVYFFALLRAGKRSILPKA